MSSEASSPGKPPLAAPLWRWLLALALLGCAAWVRGAVDDIRHPPLYESPWGTMSLQDETPPEVLP